MIPGDLFHVALGLSADLGKTFVKLVPELDTGVLAIDLALRWSGQKEMNNKIDKTYHKCNAGTQHNIDGTLCTFDNVLGEVEDVQVILFRRVATVFVWLQAATNLERHTESRYLPNNIMYNIPIS
jgi:hypothetical protein